MIKVFIMGVSALAIVAGGGSIANAQSNEQLRRDLQEARERIRLLEQFQNRGDLPPVSGDGVCYSRVLVPPSPRTLTETITVSEARRETRIIPAVYDTVSERVVLEPQRTVRRVIPAQFDTVTERVLIEPERVERRVIPAQFRTVTETVVVSDAFSEPVVRPAVYEEYTEQVLVREAYFTWQPAEPLFRAAQSDAASAGDFARRNFDASDLRELPTGEILCRVEVPAQYETITRTRLVQPERIEYRTADGRFSPNPVEIGGMTRDVTRQVEVEPERVVEQVIPAVYETVTRTVEVEPERVVEEIIPAQFDTVQRRVLVSPAREEQETVPAETRTITRTVFDGDSQFNWREVLCEINTTPEAIRTIQLALRDQGFNPGPIDGVFDQQTYSAMVAYQNANNLPEGNLTRDFVEHLGVPWEPLTVNFYGQLRR